MISLKVDNLTYRTTQDDVRDLVGFSSSNPPLGSLAIANGWRRPAVKHSVTTAHLIARPPALPAVA
jgi:hypothetical protein